MEQEHRITYKAGITRTPSDFLCADGELAECINLATDTEELKPMVQPASYITGLASVQKLRYIHKLNDQEAYIICESDNQSISIKWGTVNSSGQYVPAQSQGADIVLWTCTGNPQITSIGNTLIINDDNGMVYHKWDGTGYKKITYPIPDIHFEAKMANSPDGAEDFVYNSANVDGILDSEVGSVPSGGLPYLYTEWSVAGDQQEEYNNLVVGLYAKNLKQVAESKGFAEPFMVRAALEMYDGSYTYITNPILLFPAVTKNTKFYAYGTMSAGASRIAPKKLVAVTQRLRLFIKQTQSFEDYSDIIKDVVVFASAGVKLYNTSQDQPCSNRLSDYNVGNSVRSTETANPGHLSNSVWDLTSYTPPSTAMGGLYTSYNSLRCLTMREEKSIQDDIEATSVFYKIASLGLKPTNGFEDIGNKTTMEVLANLTTQERLESDDYFSRNKLIPNYVYPYNSRLNLSNVKRGFFSGFEFFMPFDGNTTKYDIWVKIKTDYGSVVVKHTTDLTSQILGYYFYYPDNRATHVVIIPQNDPLGVPVLKTKLKEHPFLHGAYYFAGLPAETMPLRDNTSGENLSETVNQTEVLPNYIIQSEVNNPWIFKAEGYNKVAWGEVLAITAITQGLSQGQNGPYPLLVFTNVGIWNMAVDKTGIYLDSQPVGRDILLNKSSVIQTDNAVFFVSKKGLMVAEPRNSRWVTFTCVSERMNGATFNTASLISFSSDNENPTPDPADDWKAIIKGCQTSRSFLDYIRSENCFMAYDYIDSRIHIINSDFDFSFVYNIADGTISKTVLPAAMTNAVNDYPDYLLQGTVTVANPIHQEGESPVLTQEQRVFSFYRKPREEEVSNRQLGFLLTRPMKLAGPVSKDSLRQLMNVGTWDRGTSQSPLSCVKTDIYLSDDMKNWFNMASRFGTAAKYYRMALYIKMLPTERLSGTILTEQPRRTNNLK